MARQLEHEQGTGASLRGTRSFGRNDDGTVNEDEAKVLRELWEPILNGDSIYRWVNTLNDRGVTTSRGNPWTSPGLSHLLRNPRLAGHRFVDGEFLRIEGLAPIVSLDEHCNMVSVLDSRAGERPPRTDDPTKRKYLLTSGIAKCGRCGKPLHAKGSEGKTRSYACVKASPHFGCGRIRMQAKALEDAVAVEVLAKLSRAANRRRLQAAINGSERTSRQLAEKISEARDGQRKLATMYKEKKVSATALQAGDAEYEREIRGYRDELARLRGLAALPLAGDITHQELATWWEETSTVQERHDLVAALLEEIQIKPGIVGFHGFDSDRVVYVWRIG